MARKEKHLCGIKENPCSTLVSAYLLFLDLVFPSKYVYLRITDIRDAWGIFKRAPGKSSFQAQFFHALILQIHTLKLRI